MKLKITTTVCIDIDLIVGYVKDNGLTIEEAVDFEIACLEDYEGYLIGKNERKKIIKKVKKTLDKQ